MSVTIKPNKMKYKNSSGNYVGINAIAEQTTAEEVADIQAASTAAQGEITNLTNTKKTEIDNKAAEVTSQLANAAEVRNMLAGTFSTSTNYKKGQYVIQTVTVSGNSVNKLYRFTADHPAGNWLGTDVVEVKLADDVNSLSSAIDEVVSEYIPKGIVKGRYVNNTTGVISNYSAWDGSDFIDISGKTKIYVTNGGNQSTIWNGFFANKTDTTAISVFSVPNGETKAVDVPVGAKYVILSHYTAQYPLLNIKSDAIVRIESLETESAKQAETDTVFKKDLNIALKNSASDTSFYFNPLDFELGNISSDGFEPYSKRIASRKVFVYDKAISIKAIGAYKFYINLLAADGSYDRATGWKNNHTLPSGQKFMIMFSPYGSEVPEVLDENLIPDYIVNLSYSFVSEHSYHGERIIPARQGFKIQQLGIEPNETMQSTSQGLAVYEHILFQICGDVNGTGKIVAIDIDTEEIIGTYSISVGHGGSAFFLTEFYNNNDDYPLLCVSTNAYPNVIQVFRLTESEAIKIREYTLQTADGYWAQATYDPLTGRLYSIGYTANSYTDATNNKTIIAIYDLLNVTETDTNVFSPTFVNRYSIPFIYCTQGLKYYAGKIIVISSYSNITQKTWLYLIDPASCQIMSIIKDFPTLISDWEVEGIDVVDDNWIIIGTRPRYFKMSLY